jgi:hypothetical protein
MQDKQCHIKDRYEGKIIQTWEDEDYVYLSFPNVTVSYPVDMWKEIVKELRKVK